MTQLVFVAVFMAAAFGYTFWMKKKAAQGLADARPAFHAFFERTGYRYADIAQLPVAAQVDRAYQEAASPNPTGNLDLHYVRNFHGLPIHYRSRTWSEQGPTSSTFYRSNQWDADLARPPRIAIHVADKKLDSTLKKVGEAFSNTRRNFTPKCSQRVPTGIPAIDDKFVVFGDDPNAVRWLFQQNPGLVQMLQGWAEVDVWVAASGACFNDPSYANIMAAMGGTVGSMAMGFDYGKRTELSIPVHDRVAELLGTLVRATA